jgi:hypothetical protein
MRTKKPHTTHFLASCWACRWRVRYLLERRGIILPRGRLRSLTSRRQRRAG